MVSFVPPDGAFTLMSYRVDGVTQMPLSVRPSVAVAGQTGRIHIAVSPRHNDRKAVEDLVLTIPLPKATLSTALSASGGSIRYDETRKIVRWEIGFLPESKQQVLEGTFELPAGYVYDEMTVVSVRCVSQQTFFLYLSDRLTILRAYTCLHFLVLFIAHRPISTLKCLPCRASRSTA